MVRFKNRYIVGEVSPPPQGLKAISLDSEELYQWVSRTVEQIHGEFGAAATRSGLAVKYFNPDTRIGIIRVRHGPHKLIASALPFASSLQKHKLQIRTLYIGASLSCCFKFLQKYQRSQLDVLWSRADSTDRQKLEKVACHSNVSKLMRDVS